MTETDCPIVLGDVPVPTGDFLAYLRAAGARDWTPAPLPCGAERGVPKSCFMNATHALLADGGLDYCEGVGFTPGLPFGFLHAWAVDADGNVVDPTWNEPERCRYYGVRYDRARYLKHIQRTGYYGVFGGSNQTARRVLAKGGL